MDFQHAVEDTPRIQYWMHVVDGSMDTFVDECEKERELVGNLVSLVGVGEFLGEMNGRVPWKTIVNGRAKKGR